MNADRIAAAAIELARRYAHAWVTVHGDHGTAGGCHLCAELHAYTDLLEDELAAALDHPLTPVRAAA